MGRSSLGSEGAQEDFLQEETCEWGPELLLGITKGRKKGRVFQQRKLPVARAGFLNLHIVDTWGQIILGGCSVSCRMVNSIPCL